MSQQASHGGAGRPTGGETDAIERAGPLGVESGLEALRTSTEFRGPVEPLDGGETNEHIALFYESDAERMAAVVPFVRQGLQRGERVMYVLGDETEAEARDHLRAAGVDVDGAVNAGDLSFHTLGETYLRNGTFDPDEMIEFYGETLAEATAEYPALRITASTDWILRDETTVEAFMEYESRVNDLFEGEDCVALCQYDRGRMPADLLRDVVRTHPHLIYGGVLCHNFYYTPPGEYFEPDEPGRDVERMLGTLRDRTEAKAELADRERSLRRLNDIAADPDASFEEKLQSLFELGSERFDLELGAMARVDVEADRFVVEYVGDDHEHLEPDTALPLSETFCTAVTERRATGSVTDPLAEGFEDATVYREFGLRTYLGSYVDVDGAADRTFFFVDSESRAAPFSDGQRAFLGSMAQWVSYELEQSRREDHLAALNALSRDVMQAVTEREVSETVVEAAASSLDLPVTAIAHYDAGAGELRQEAATGRADELLDVAALLERGDGVAWRAFVEGECVRRPTRAAGDDPSVHPSVAELAVVPLGAHGVLVTGTLAPDGFGTSTFDVVETVAANAEAALDSAERERELHDREETLEQQTETLERLNRVNDIIRGIDRVLVQASTREEVVTAVCDRLAAAEPYRFAWIGTHDAVTDAVTPEAAAGADDGYLDAVTVTIDDGPGDAEPAAAAVRTGETQVLETLAGEPPFTPWQQAALDRGFRSGIAVPLVFQETQYGVLTLYAAQPDAFDRMEEMVLTELGETIGYALNALERKRALVSEQSVELGLAVRRGGPTLFRVAAELDCEVEFVNVVRGADASPRVYFTIRDAGPEAVLEYGRGRADVASVRLVNERADEALFEAELRDSAFLAELLERGAMPRALTATGEEGSVEIRIPRSSDVRGYLDLFEAHYEDVELVRRREVDEPITSQREFESAVRSDLTDRQAEIVETAYSAGYFEWPRETTAQDLAETLDVSQPTISRHVRAGERTLFGLVFDRE